MAHDHDECALPHGYLLFARYREFLGRYAAATASSAVTIAITLPREQHLDCEGLAMLVWAATVAKQRGKRLAVSVESVQARQVLEFAGLSLTVRWPAERDGGYCVRLGIPRPECARPTEGLCLPRPCARVSCRTSANRRHR